MPPRLRSPRRARTPRPPRRRPPRDRSHSRRRPSRLTRRRRRRGQRRQRSRRASRAAPAEWNAAPASFRCISTSARESSSSRSRATPCACSRSSCNPRGSAPTRSASIAARTGPIRSRASIATATACSWCSRTGTTAATPQRDPGLATTVAESFPPSTVAALPLLAVEDGRLLVDATDFVYRDWIDVSGTLCAHQRGQLRGGARPLEHRPRVHEGVPREHRDRRRVDVRHARGARAKRYRRSCPTAARSRCASTSRSFSCPMRDIGRARSIRASASSASRSRTTRSRFRARSSSAGSRVIASSA